MTGPWVPSDNRNYAGIGKQVSRGTAVAPSIWVPYHESVDFDHGLGLEAIKEAGGAGQVTYTEKTEHMPGGKLPFLARPVLMGKAYSYLLGVDTVGAAVSSVYPHVVTQDFDTDYLTVEQNYEDDFLERIQDCVLSEITWEADVENPALRCSVSWVGGAPIVQASATTESYETDRPFLISDGTFTLDGGSATNIRRISVTSKIILSRERVTNVVHEYVCKVAEEVEVEIEQLLTADFGDYRKVNYGTTSGSAHLKTATSGAFIADFAYGATTTARGFKFEVPALDYDQAEITKLDPNGNQAVHVVTRGHGRYDRTNPLQKVTAKTTDSAAYVS